MFPKTCKILVVDDDPVSRRNMQSVLKEIGYTNVETVDGAPLALSKLQESNRGGSRAQYELVISDWNMPSMTGLELLSSVRQNKDTMNLPFIMMTTEDTKQNIFQAVKAGVSSFAAKPVTAAVFRMKIDAAYVKHFSKAS